MGDNKKSTILKDTIALLVITLTAGLALGFVYEITKAPIEAQEMAVKLEAYEVVYKDADTIKIDENLTELAEEIDMKELDQAFSYVTIKEVNEVYNGSEEVIGYISVIGSSEGYGGDISLAIGYSLDGEMQGMEVLDMSETPDLGTKINDDEFKGQFKDVKAEKFSTSEVSNDTEVEVDEVSGATISTDAAINAINGGIRFLNEYSDIMGGEGNE